MLYSCTHPHGNSGRQNYKITAVRSYITKETQYGCDTLRILGIDKSKSNGVEWTSN